MSGSERAGLQMHDGLDEAADARTYECDFGTWSDGSLGKPVALLYRHYCTFLDHELAPYGLTAAHIPLLGHLWAGGAGDNQNSIARTLGVDKATVSRCAAYLVKAGLVTQSVSPRDSRALTLGLTEAGENLCHPVGDILRRWTAAITDGMDPAAVDAVIGDLQRMIDNAGRLLSGSGIHSANSGGPQG